MLQMLRKRRADEGFTLIELLIVIVILGVLAAVVVISVAGITDRGRKSACEASRTSVLTAGEAYYAQTGNTISGGSGSNAWSLTYTPATNAITACPA